MAAPPATGTPNRWDSLDVLRGIALCLMVTHHFHQWTAGGVRDRFIGYPGMVVTDIAAPAFAVGVGAAALMVGRQVAGPRGVDWGRARRAGRRWFDVLLLGLAIDVAVGGGVDGGGVLPTLAVLGTAVTVCAALGLRSSTVWWLVAAACAAGATAATGGDPHGFLAQLWAGPFSIVTYGTFAAAGAALAARASGGGERRLPLVAATIGVAIAGTAGGLSWPEVLAPDGLWPPDRTSGGVAFTMWGLLGTLVLWMTARALTARDDALVRGLGRAGRRTLLVFGGHYLVKVALQWTDALGELDSPDWQAATWVAAVFVCALSMLPSPAERPLLGGDHLGTEPLTSARERVGHGSFVT